MAPVTGAIIRMNEVKMLAKIIATRMIMIIMISMLCTVHLCIFCAPVLSCPSLFSSSAPSKNLMITIMYTWSYPLPFRQDHLDTSFVSLSSVDLVSFHPRHLFAALRFFISLSLILICPISIFIFALSRLFHPFSSPIFRGLAPF